MEYGPAITTHVKRLCTQRITHHDRRVWISGILFLAWRSLLGRIGSFVILPLCAVQDENVVVASWREGVAIWTTIVYARIRVPYFQVFEGGADPDL